ncbi:Uncharacterized protein DBV15_11028 [Temnothorax longispinosus]|uniref:Uncharacterized protein n=1 Tax=Temnothorax longispinosus TaxID=300112 RepID=A0A4S2KS54_9HYME|nr:Uncharacterized protein DBV15_11028 [Temnothorax longispinosus]
MRNPHYSLSIYDVLNDPRPSSASHLGRKVGAWRTPDVSSHRRPRRAFLSWNENKKRRTSRGRRKNGTVMTRRKGGTGGEKKGGHTKRGGRGRCDKWLVKTPGRGVMECGELNGGAQKSEPAAWGASVGYNSFDSRYRCRRRAARFLFFSEMQKSPGDRFHTLCRQEY